MPKNADVCIPCRKIGLSDSDYETLVRDYVAYIDEDKDSRAALSRAAGSLQPVQFSAERPVQALRLLRHDAGREDPQPLS